MKNKLKKKAIYFLIGVLSIIYFFYFQNNALVTSRYPVQSARIPKKFEGYKIIQLSDLHNKMFGKNQHRLVGKVKKAAPDMIFFTGDIVDVRRYDEEPSLTLMEELVKIAPVFYVSGNHEWASRKFNKLEVELIKHGVQVLRNETKEITIGTDKILLTGIDDPTDGFATWRERSIAENNLIMSGAEVKPVGVFRILLAHRPEMFSLYQQYGFDLIFSGHAHGGQIRIPFTGGLYAPHQGMLPKYTTGKHDSSKASLIVNRGLGNSLFPFRIFNRPEIVEVILISERSCFNNKALLHSTILK